MTESSELTSTCEQSTVWVQLPGQVPKTPWVLDYNIVQSCPRYYFANMKDNLCFFVGVPFDTHTALLIQKISITVVGPGAALRSFSVLVQVVPLISSFLQSASREINIIEGHSRRYTEPSSLCWRGSFFVKKKVQQKSHRTGDLGSHLLHGPITHRLQWSH